MPQRLFYITPLLAVVVVPTTVTKPAQDSAGALKPGATSGLITAISTRFISVKNDASVSRIKLTSATKIRKPFPISSKNLGVGDDVIVWLSHDQEGTPIASAISANMTKWGGTVISVRGNTFSMIGDTGPESGPGDAPGKVEVTFESRTVYVHGSRHQLRAGVYLEATGSYFGNNHLLASALDLWTSSPTGATKPPHK